MLWADTKIVNRHTHMEKGQKLYSPMATAYFVCRGYNNGLKHIGMSFHFKGNSIINRIMVEMQDTRIFIFTLGLNRSKSFLSNLN